VFPAEPPAIAWRRREEFGGANEFRRILTTRGCGHALCAPAKRQQPSSDTDLGSKQWRVVGPRWFRFVDLDANSITGIHVAIDCVEGEIALGTAAKFDDGTPTTGAIDHTVEDGSDGGWFGPGEDIECEVTDLFTDVGDGVRASTESNALAVVCSPDDEIGRRIRESLFEPAFDRLRSLDHRPARRAEELG
jgi:hypothetical protein